MRGLHVAARRTRVEARLQYAPAQTDRRAPPAVNLRRRQAAKRAGSRRLHGAAILAHISQWPDAVDQQGGGSNGGCLTGGPPTARNRKRAQKKLKKQRVAETYGRKPPTGSKVPSFPIGILASEWGGQPPLTSAAIGLTPHHEIQYTYRKPALCSPPPHMRRRRASAPNNGPALESHLRR